jgi:hypothetical protein
MSLKDCEIKMKMNIHMLFDEYVNRILALYIFFIQRATRKKSPEQVNLYQNLSK